jgi:hypothetical protein
VSLSKRRCRVRDDENDSNFDDRTRRLGTGSSVRALLEKLMPLSATKKMVDFCCALILVGVDGDDT